MAFNVSCIKCKSQYESPDPDPYYCPVCYAEKQELAKEIDKKLSMRGPKRPVESELQRFDKMKKVGGIAVNIRDLGISL